jgi:hypothetical protein
MILDGRTLGERMEGNPRGTLGTLVLPAHR